MYRGREPIVPMNWTLMPVCSSLLPSFGRTVTAPLTDSPSIKRGAFSRRFLSSLTSTIERSSVSSRTTSISTGVAKKYDMADNCVCYLPLAPSVLLISEMRLWRKLYDSGMAGLSWAELLRRVGADVGRGDRGPMKTHRACRRYLNEAEQVDKIWMGSEFKHEYGQEKNKYIIQTENYYFSYSASIFSYHNYRYSAYRTVVLQRVQLPIDLIGSQLPSCRLITCIPHQNCSRGKRKPYALPVFFPAQELRIVSPVSLNTDINSQPAG